MDDIMGMAIGMAAVVLIFSTPFALMFTIYRLRKLKTEERLAAIAKGVLVSLEPEVPQPARLRGLGILLVASGVGFSLACWLMSLVERDVVVAAPLGVIPFAIGIGYFINASLIRRELSGGTKG